MIYKSLNLKHLFSICLFFLSLSLFAQPTAEEGKSIFRNKCATCHAKDMKTKATGPALGGVEERWADYPREDLYNWVRNSQGLIAAGHPRANELWNEWGSVMNAFPELTDDNIESLIAYINNPLPQGLTPVPGTETVAEKGNPLTKYLYWILFLLLAVLAFVLSRVIANLNVISAEKEGKYVERKTIMESLTSKGVVTFALFGLVLLGGYTTVNNAVDLGRQQGYAPEQPIKFSHATHAGTHKIDCQYCHDGARRSKHAVIPAANTCMNCHAAITSGSTYGTAEITKIFASTGYDPSTAKYIEDYDNKSPEELEAIYKKWITDKYLEETGLAELDREGKRIVKEQWNNIVSSLTNDQKTRIGGGIEWERIHNLPDHVYFNHAQHVAVGGVECEACHGKVDEMEVLQQYSPLSMGWCINCHRQTEVQFADNDYYKSYSKYHKELASGAKDKVTVEDIGGLECQKCHY